MLAAISLPDAIVAIICGLAAVRGAVKGFSWQAVRLLGLAAGLWGASTWHEPVAAWLAANVGFIPDELTPVVAWIAIFVGILLVATWFAWVARGAIRRIELGGADRLFGFALGGAMGLVLVTAGFLLWGRFTSTAKLANDLEGAVTAPFMAKAAELLSPLLPADVRQSWADVLKTLDEAGATEAAPEAGSPSGGS